MTTAREIMSGEAKCCDANETLADVAMHMREMHVGAMPICGNDQRLHGIITDRDIVVKCVAEGRDPSGVTAGQLANGNLVWVDAEADMSDCLSVMEDNGIRRVPVLAEKRLVGMISEADIAQHMNEGEISEFVQRVTGAPPNS
ncbi:CBS domain-containing protein [Salininema proteolyticum]|uniref:CBS domain-containing protein n=1 Tax=Salininema proteolyticum TaxID=1607685 RepID=A0ABV8U220_9ACTN